MYHFHSCQECVRVLFFRILINTVLLSIAFCEYAVVTHYDFDLHFLMTKYVEHLFMGVLAIQKSSLVKCLFQSFTHFLIKLSTYYGVVKVLLYSTYFCLTFKALNQIHVL